MNQQLKKRKNSTVHLIRILSLTLLTFAFASCETTNDPLLNENKTSVSVTFSANAPTSESKRTASTTSDSISIIDVKMLIAQIEFEYDMEDDGVSDDTLEFETGPLVVALNTAGMDTTIVNLVPDRGTYDEIEIEIEQPDEGTVPDSSFVDGDNRYSIVANGSYNGSPFVFRTDLEMELELELEPPIIIDGTSPMEVNIAVDISEWFTDANGDPLDPSQESNRSQIEQNIKNSFHASESDEQEDSDDNDD